MSEPLNVLGRRDQPCDNDAIMIGRAFEYAASYGTVKTFWDYVAEYVADMATDRRYKVKIKAASVGSTIDSAIIEYRGRRLYVWSRYDALNHTRIYYVEKSER